MVKKHKKMVRHDGFSDGESPSNMQIDGLRGVVGMEIFWINWNPVRYHWNVVN